MGRRPSGRRQRPTKRCSQASMPLYVPGLPAPSECAAASSRPICSTDCWLLPPPVPAQSVSANVMPLAHWILHPQAWPGPMQIQ